MSPAPLSRIPIADLRQRWQREGPHGEWRALLRTGYAEGEPYFEFGVMPESKHPCRWRIVLDHAVPVWLCDESAAFNGEHVIRPDDRRAGQVVVTPGGPARGGLAFTTYHVTWAEFERMQQDAAEIHREYADPVSVSFWSIPNRWYSDRALVQFLAARIVNTDTYRSRPRGRTDWYWP
jgi:hypothetical protein